MCIKRLTGSCSTLVGGSSRFLSLCMQTKELARHFGRQILPTCSVGRGETDGVDEAALRQQQLLAATRFAKSSHIQLAVSAIHLQLLGILPLQRLNLNIALFFFNNKNLALWENKEKSAVAKRKQSKMFLLIQNIEGNVQLMIFSKLLYFNILFS